MSGALLALLVAAAPVRPPLPFAPVPVRAGPPAGKVVEAARGRGWLDAGALDGLAAGQELRLTRGGAPAGTCRVEAVADRSAACRAEGIRAGDRVELPTPPAAEAAPAPVASPLGAEESARRREAIEATTVPRVTAKPLPPRPRLHLYAVETGGRIFTGGTVTRHQGYVVANVRNAPVGKGLRLDVDLSAVLRSAGADRSTFRPGDTWLLEVREAALSSLEGPGALSYAAGRFVPRRAPGAGRIDGAQAALRKGGLEYGAFAGVVPDPRTTEPTTSRATAGLFLGADQGRLGLFARGEARVAWVRSPELDDRLEADALAFLALARTLDLSGRARFGVGGAAQAKGGLDEARLDLSTRVGRALALSGGIRYVGLEVPDLALPSAAAFPGPSRRADVGVSWAAADWLGVRLFAGGARDVESGLERGFAGPEVQAWLFSRRLGLQAGYQEETGWLSGRTLWVGGSSAFFRAVRFSLRASLTMDERVSPLPAELDAGGTAAVDWQITPWLALRGSALVLASVTTGRDLGGRGFVELVGRR